MERRRTAVIGAALVLRVALDLAGVGGVPTVPVAGALVAVVALAAGNDLFAGIRHRSSAAIAGFAGILVLSALRTDTLSPYWLGLYLSPFVVYLAARSVQREAAWRWTWMVGAVATVPLLLDLLALATGQPADHVVNGYPRLLGAYANPHSHAVALAVFASIGLLWLEVETDRMRGVGAALLVVSLAFLGLTWVRTAMLMLAVHTAVFLALRRRWPWLAVGAGLAVVAFLASPGLRDRFGDLVAVLSGTAPEQGWGAVGSWRFAIWQDAVAKFSETGRWLTGLGLGAHHTLHKDLDPHSEVLTLLFQAGVLAPALWYLALGTAVAEAVAGRGQDGSNRAMAFGDHAIAWGIAIGLAAPISNDVLPRMTLVWWVFAGLGASARGVGSTLHDQPGSEGGGQRDGQVVVDPLGEQLGDGPEQRGHQGDLEAVLGVEQQQDEPGGQGSEGGEGQ